MTNNNEALDLSAIKERVDGDKALFLELSEMFLAQYQSQIQILADAIKASDYHTAKTTAHSLKGTLANLSAVTASAQALKLEKQAAAHDLTHAGGDLQNLVNEILKFEELVQKVSETDIWESV